MKFYRIIQNLDAYDWPFTVQEYVASGQYWTNIGPEFKSLFDAETFVSGFELHLSPRKLVAKVMCG